MKRLTYFQVHKNKTAKKLPFFISKSIIDKCLNDMKTRFNLIKMMEDSEEHQLY